MRRLVLLVALLAPSFASAQAVVRTLTQTYLDARYCNLTGGTNCELTAGLFLTETTTPSPSTGTGALYTTTANDVRFVDGAGVDHVVHGFPTPITHSFSNIGSGTHYLGGFYETDTTDTNLTQASTTATAGHGDDDEPWAAHIFIVAKQAGTATGGSGAVTIVVTGTSYTDAGVYVGADSETLVADITAMSTDEYFETTKKWLGQVTITLTVGATGHTAYAADFNMGWAAYSDWQNSDFTITGLECRGQAGANTTLDIELLHHPNDGSGWTFNDGAFVPGNGALAKMSTEYEGSEVGLTSGKGFNFKRTGLSQAVVGTGLGGYLIRVTTGANNAVDFMDCRVWVEF